MAYSHDFIMYNLVGNLGKKFVKIFNQIFSADETKKVEVKEKDSCAVCTIIPNSGPNAIPRYECNGYKNNN